MNDYYTQLTKNIGKVTILDPDSFQPTLSIRYRRKEYLLPAVPPHLQDSVVVGIQIMKHLIGRASVPYTKAMRAWTHGYYPISIGTPDDPALLLDDGEDTYLVQSEQEILDILTYSQVVLPHYVRDGNRTLITTLFPERVHHDHEETAIRNAS